MYSTKPRSASTLVDRKARKAAHCGKRKKEGKDLRGIGAVFFLQKLVDMTLTSLGRALMNFSMDDLNTCSFSYGVSMGNFRKNNKEAFGDRAALMILEAARDQLEYVATSFVAPKMTVVVY